MSIQISEKDISQIFLEQNFLHSIGGSYRDYLCTLLQHSDPSTQRTIMAHLSRLPPERRDPILAYMLWHSHPVVRDAAIRTVTTCSPLSSFLYRAVVALPSVRSQVPPSVVSRPHVAPPSETEPGYQVSACHVSIPDGSGHISLFLSTNHCDQPNIISLLFHVRRGIINVAILPFSHKEARDRSFAYICSDVNVYHVTSKNIHHLLRECLLLTIKNNTYPPPLAVGLLPFLVESDIRRLSIFQGANESLRKPKTTKDRAPASRRDSVNWVTSLPALASWITALAARGPFGDNTREKLDNIFNCLEQDRAFWQANLLWIARLLPYCDCPEKHLASPIARLARTVEKGTPLRDIALFRQIAYRTLLMPANRMTEKNRILQRLYGPTRDRNI